MYKKETFWKLLTCTEGEADTQMDPNKRDDFLFALFIAQEPDPQLLSNEAAGSSSAVVWKSNHPVIFPKEIVSHTA